MTLSILHRITGVTLAVGLVAMAYWLFAVATGGARYEQLAAIMGSIPGKLFLIGWSFAFFLHLANGVRHLFWDSGRGFEKSQANASAWLALLFAVAMTVFYWVIL